MKIYPRCLRYYPFVLGAQPVRMIDLAAFYAAIAQEGVRPQPHGIDSIEVNGQTIYRYPDEQNSAAVDPAERASFYQLKTILQGVVARGTARAIASLSPYVAGKTGTTEDVIDGWFVGFTNDVTVAVWVGYDNADRKRRSLGSSETGASVALPIFEPIMEAIWSRKIAPKAQLSGPSPEAQHKLVEEAIDYQSGDRVRGGKGFIEHFRLGPDNKFHDTQYQILSGQASNDEHGGAKRKEAKARGEASKRTSARRTQQAARQVQGREYYDSWQPFGRGQESNYRW